MPVLVLDGTHATTKVYVSKDALHNYYVNSEFDAVWCCAMARIDLADRLRLVTRASLSANRERLASLPCFETRLG